MENKEIKNIATELNDAALDDVSGGALVRIILDENDDMTKAICATCGEHIVMQKTMYEHRLVSGVYYCDACRAKLV